MNTSAGIEYYQNPLGQNLRCQLHLPENSKDKKTPVLAYIHGIGGSMHSPATIHSMNTVLENGIAVFSFDATPTVEKKNGPFTFKADTRDLSPHSYVQTIHAALRYLDEKHHDEVDMEKLSLHCSSLGAYCGATYAAHANGLADKHRVIKEKTYAPKAVILQSPVLKPLDVAGKIVDNPLVNFAWRVAGFVPWPIGGEWLNVSYNVYKESRHVDFNRDIAPHITAPVEIHIGDTDPLEKTETIRAFKENLIQSPEKELHIYPDSGHALEDYKKLSAISEKDIKVYLCGRNILRKRTAREGYYLINNFMDNTFCREATEKSVAFIKRFVS